MKAFKQEGVSIAGIRKAYNDSKKINIKIEVEYMPFNCLHLFSLKARLHCHCSCGSYDDL